MAQLDARVLVYPSRFPPTSGPSHWELLLRTRAVDTQCYTVGVTCAKEEEDGSAYQAWGHSMVVDPLGKILTEMGQNPSI